MTQIFGVKAWIGKTLMGIAACHSMVGVILHRSVLDALLEDGVFNTIALGNNPSREAAFWFLCTGFMLLLVGGFVDHLERLDLDIPLFLLVALAALVLVGIVVIPLSGFWLLLVPVSGLILRKISFQRR